MSWGNGLLFSENQHRLIQLEESAKAASKGRWGPPEEIAKKVRDVKWNLDNPSIFVDSLHGKPVDGMFKNLRYMTLKSIFTL